MTKSAYPVLLNRAEEAAAYEMQALPCTDSAGPLLIRSLGDSGRSVLPASPVLSHSNEDLDILETGSAWVRSLSRRGTTDPIYVARVTASRSTPLWQIASTPE